MRKLFVCYKKEGCACLGKQAIQTDDTTNTSGDSRAGDLVTRSLGGSPASAKAIGACAAAL